MTLRPCLICGTPTDGSWCTEHRHHQRGQQDHDLSASARGYDSTWRRLSRRARRLQPWCTDCGTVNDLTADHLTWPATTLADVEVVCRACNSRRGPLRTRGGPWPGPLDWTPPGPGDLAPLRHSEPGAKIRHRLPVPDDVSDEIRRTIHAARTGGDTDPLDAHRMLLRLKIAALLGILDDRLEVTDDDWRLAGTITTTSANVRRHVLGTLRAAEQQREDAQVARHVRREAASEDAAYDRALASAATSVARKVHKHDGATRRDLARAIAGKHRQLGVTVDDAIARAVADGYIADDGAGWRPSRRTP